MVAFPRDSVGNYVGWRLLKGDPTDIAFNVYRASGEGRPVKLNDEPGPRPRTSSMRRRRRMLPVRTGCVRSSRARKVRAPRVSPSRRGPRPCPTSASSSTATTRSRRSASPTSTATAGYDYRRSSSRKPTSTRTRTTGSRAPTRTSSRPTARRATPVAARPGLGHRAGHLVLALRGLRPRRRRHGPRSPSRRARATRATPTAAWPGGPEYLTHPRRRDRQADHARIDWPSRDGLAEGSRAYNYASRNQMGVAYLDGKTPCLIVERGTYNVIKLVAYQLHGRQARRALAVGQRGESGPTGARGRTGCTRPTSTATAATRWSSARSSSTTTARRCGRTGLGHPDHYYVGDIDPGRARPGDLLRHRDPDTRQERHVPGRRRDGQRSSGATRAHPARGCRHGRRHRPGLPRLRVLGFRRRQGRPQAANFDGNPPRWLFTADGELLARDKEVPSFEVLSGTRTHSASWSRGERPGLPGRCSHIRHRGAARLLGGHSGRLARGAGDDGAGRTAHLHHHHSRLRAAYHFAAGPDLPSRHRARGHGLHAAADTGQVHHPGWPGHVAGVRAVPRQEDRPRPLRASLADLSAFVIGLVQLDAETRGLGGRDGSVRGWSVRFMRRCLWGWHMMRYSTSAAPSAPSRRRRGARHGAMAVRVYRHIVGGGAERASVHQFADAAAPVGIGLHDVDRRRPRGGRSPANAC